MADADLRELQRKAETGDAEARKRFYRAKRRAGILPTWDELRRFFADIIEGGDGPSKSKSGLIKIRVDSCNSDADVVYVELGTYDIGNWPSWIQLGNFKTFEDAQQAVADKLDEAAEEVRQEKLREKDYNCPDCGGALGGYYDHSPNASYADNWCPRCEYSFHDCEVCGKVYTDECEAGDCCEEDSEEEEV